MKFGAADEESKMEEVSYRVLRREMRHFSRSSRSSGVERHFSEPLVAGTAAVGVSQGGAPDGGAAVTVLRQGCRGAEADPHGVGGFGPKRFYRCSSSTRWCRPCPVFHSEVWSSSRTRLMTCLLCTSGC